MMMVWKQQPAVQCWNRERETYAVVPLVSWPARLCGLHLTYQPLNDTRRPMHTDNTKHTHRPIHADMTSAMTTTSTGNDGRRVEFIYYTPELERNECTNTGDRAVIWGCDMCKSMLQAGRDPHERCVFRLASALVSTLKLLRRTALKFDHIN